MREWPVHAAENLQVISGRIDLLIDDGGVFTVVDHKSFPGAMALDDKRLNAFGGRWISTLARFAKEPREISTTTGYTSQSRG